MIHVFLLLFLSSHFLHVDSNTIHEVNQALFLDPRTHSALIECPLDLKANDEFQWYDVLNQRLETERSQFYRINGTQPLDREYLCSIRSTKLDESEEKYRIKIRTYGKR